MRNSADFEKYVTDLAEHKIKTRRKRIKSLTITLSGCLAAIVVIFISFGRNTKYEEKTDADYTVAADDSGNEECIIEDSEKKEGVYMPSLELYVDGVRTTITSEIYKVIEKYIDMDEEYSGETSYVVVDGRKIALSDEDIKKIK